jgi:hypothetical protein
MKLEWNAARKDVKSRYWLAKAVAYVRKICNWGYALFWGFYVVWNPKRAHISFTPRQKHEITFRNCTGTA